MQTFLPYKSFKKSARVLDYKRLGKQRLEAKIIIDIIEGRGKGGWKHHPAVLMWMDYPDALKAYYNVMVKEWVHRGYNNTMPLYKVDTKKVRWPIWLGRKDFHHSHQVNLQWKHPHHYGEYWNHKKYVPYVWPVRIKTIKVVER
jgi:hypothetical protein